MMLRMLELGNSQGEADGGARGAVALPYASARERVAWGPFLFRPSRAALALLALAVLGAVWLGLRHHPWRLVARVPGSYDVDRPFTGDGLLITLDNEGGANLWDPASGRRVRHVLPKIDVGTNQYFVVKGGDEILALPRHERVATFFDGKSGRVLRRVPNPTLPAVAPPVVYPDGTRLITGRRNPPAREASEVFLPPAVWELKEHQPTAPPVPAGELPPSLAHMSPEGSRILMLSFGKGSNSDYALVDARQLTVLLKGIGSAQWISEELFHVQRSNLTTQPSVLNEIRSARDGSSINSMAIPDPPRYASMGFQVSTDGRYVARCLGLPFGGRTGGFPPTPAELEFFDAATGKLAYSRRSVLVGVRFLPNSSRYLTADPATLGLALYDPRHARALAVFPQTSFANASPDIKFGPDGKTLLVRSSVDDEVLSIYRRGEWDCPESHLGAMIFPQTWLTAGSFAGVMLVLFGNAARRGQGLANPVRGMALMVLLLTMPVAAYALACVCLGDYRHTVWPAPAGLLAICSIGLALGSRFWRVATLWMVAGSLPYVLWLAYRVWRAGPKGSTLYPLLDRHYEVPHLPVLIGLVGGTVLLGFVLVTLARSTRQPGA
jgi:hypothetical protein